MSKTITKYFTIVVNGERVSFDVRDKTPDFLAIRLLNWLRDGLKVSDITIENIDTRVLDVSIVTHNNMKSDLSIIKHHSEWYRRLNNTHTYFGEMCKVWTIIKCKNCGHLQLVHYSLDDDTVDHHCLSASYTSLIDNEFKDDECNRYWKKAGRIEDSEKLLSLYYY